MPLNTVLCCITDNIPNYVTGTKLMLKLESTIKKLGGVFRSRKSNVSYKKTFLQNKPGIK